MEGEIQEQENLVGKRIKLKSYSPFSDYFDHNNEIAVIERIGRGGSLPISIRWSDNLTSAVNRDNLIIINEDWDM